MQGVITETAPYQVTQGGPVIGKPALIMFYINLSDSHFILSNPSRSVALTFGVPIRLNRA